MYIAVDIGGTKTLLALFSEDGRLRKRLKMKSHQDQEKFLVEFKKFLPRILPFQKSSIKAVTFSYPGVIENGHPGRAVNLPNWNGAEIEAKMKEIFAEKKVNCKIFYKNDADLGALYECYGHSGLTVYLTFGTGIGGGIVRSQRLTSASAKFEPGHIMKTYRGKRLEWEKIASSKAIRAANNDLDVTKISDKKALDDVACRIALGLSDFAKEYHPNQFVLSGPIVAVFPGFKDTLAGLLEASLPKGSFVPRIYPAARPQESVIYGAYLYGRSKN